MACNDLPAGWIQTQDLTNSPQFHCKKNVRLQWYERTIEQKLVNSFFRGNSRTETTHLEKLHMHFPSWRSPVPSLDIPCTVWSMEYHFHPNVLAFFRLIDNPQNGKNGPKNDRTYQTIDFLFIPFSHSVKKWGLAAVNASHSGLCLVSITPAFCPRRKYKKQRGRKKILLWQVTLIQGFRLEDIVLQIEMNTQLRERVNRNTVSLPPNAHVQHL